MIGILLLAGAAGAALVAIYMTRPVFPPIVQSAAVFFADEPPTVVTGKVALDRLRLTRLFVLQALVMALLFAAILSEYLPGTAAASAGIGVSIVLDRSASMSTRQAGRTRFELARAEVARVVAWPWPGARCFRLSALDLELRTIVDQARTSGEILSAVDRLEPRALGTDLALAQRAIGERRGDRQDGCRVDVVVVVSDMPAPLWMEAAAARGDVWIDVSLPVANLGLTRIDAVRDPFTGTVNRIALEVDAYGGARDRAALVVQRPDGSEQARFTVDPSADRSSAHAFVPEVSGRYRIALAPGGAYAYDDVAVIDVPKAGEIRVDWQVGDSRWPARLGWTRDRVSPDLRVVPAVGALDARPAILIGSGYARAPGRVQPIADFVETSPLLSGLNLDVAERLGLEAAPSLSGFEPVLRGEAGALWVAARAQPPAVYVPGLPLEGDDNVARFSATLFLNAARWVLQRRSPPPLYRLTSPAQPDVSGNVLALHPGEGDTGRTPHSAGTLDAAAAAPAANSLEPWHLWPWLLLAATLVFVAERSLGWLRGWS